MIMNEIDLYKILGLTKKANRAAIRKAYMSLASQHHPDREGGNTQKFQEIKFAYEILYDEEARKKYDNNGVVTKEPTKTAQALQELAKLFIQILKDNISNIEEVDLRATLELNVNHNLEGAHKELMQTEEVRNKLTQTKEKITSSQYIFHSSIDHELGKLTHKIEALDHTIQILEIMRDLCSDFQYEFQETTQQTIINTFSGTSTFFIR